MKRFLFVVLILTSALAAFGQTKTVTNKDLEKYREQRVEADRRLKEKYAAMGFSSIAEANKYFDEKRARENAYLDSLRRERALTQNEIIAAGNALRLEIASIEAQINYLRSQNQTVYAQPQIFSYGYAPFGYGTGYFPAPQRRNAPRAIRSPRELNPVIPGGSSVAVPARRPNTNDQTWNRYGSNYGRRGIYRGGYLAPVIIGGSSGYIGNDVNDRLLSLEQQRAGLLAEWRLLEDRARRAGFRLD